MDDISRGIQHATFADASDFSEFRGRAAGPAALNLKISWHAIRMRYELDRDLYKGGGNCRSPTEATVCGSCGSRA